MYSHNSTVATNQLLRDRGITHHASHNLGSVIIKN